MAEIKEPNRVATPAPVATDVATPAPAVEGKKRYNLFKNQQGKYELQVPRIGGRVSRTVYDTEADAEKVVKALGLDKKK